MFAALGLLENFLICWRQSQLSSAALGNQLNLFLPFSLSLSLSLSRSVSVSLSVCTKACEFNLGALGGMVLLIETPRSTCRFKYRTIPGGVHSGGTEAVARSYTLIGFVALLYTHPP